MMIQQTHARVPESVQSWGVLVLLGAGFFVSVSYGYELFGLLGAAALLAVFAYGSIRTQITFLVLFLPLEYQGFDAGFAILGPYDLVADLFVVGFLLRLLYAEKMRVPIPAVFAASFVMVGLFLPSVFATNSLGSSIKELIRLSLALLTSYGICHHLSKHEDGKFTVTLMKLFVVETAFLSLWAIYLAATGSLIQIIAGRVFPSVFEDVNFYSAYVVLALAMSIGLAISERRPVAKMFYWSATSFMTLSVILTVSRAGLIALAVTIILFVFFSFSQLKGAKRISTAIAAVLVAGIGIAVLFSSPAQKTFNVFGIFDRFQGALTGQDRSVRERTKLIGVAWNVFVENPLLGVGYGAFEDSFDHYRGAQLELGKKRSVHNTPLRILAETGVVGFLGAVAFVVALFRSLFHAVKNLHDFRKKALLFSLFAALCGYIITSFTLDELAESHFWVILGITAGFMVQSTGQTASQTPSGHE